MLERRLSSKLASIVDGANWCVEAQLSNRFGQNVRTLSERAEPLAAELEDLIFTPFSEFPRFFKNLYKLGSGYAATMRQRFPDASKLANLSKRPAA